MRPFRTQLEKITTRPSAPTQTSGPFVQGHADGRGVCPPERAEIGGPPGIKTLPVVALSFPSSPLSLSGPHPPRSLDACAAMSARAARVWDRPVRALSRSSYLDMEANFCGAPPPPTQKTSYVRCLPSSVISRALLTAVSLVGAVRHDGHWRWLAPPCSTAGGDDCGVTCQSTVLSSQSPSVMLTFDSAILWRGSNSRHGPGDRLAHGWDLGPGAGPLGESSGPPPCLGV